MQKYEVYFTLRYEVEAPTRSDAEELAREEFKKEIDEQETLAQDAHIEVLELDED